jgi:hypothetical protein
MVAGDDSLRYGSDSHRCDVLISNLAAALRGGMIMTVRNAIKEAAKSVQMVCYRGSGNASNQYAVHTYNQQMKMWDEGMGQKYTYIKARRIRTANVALHALGLLGNLHESTYYAIEEMQGAQPGMSAREIVRRLHK